jgi:hypothetical protein
MARKLEEISGTPLRFCAVLDRVAALLDSSALNGSMCPILPISRRIVALPAGRGPARRRAVVV